MALNGAKPAKIYRDLIDSAPTTAEEHKVFAPRDGRQVYNAIRNSKETRMISHHSFFNLHTIATYLNTFIQTINTFPSLRIFAVNLITVEIFREIRFRDGFAYSDTFQNPLMYFAIVKCQRIISHLVKIV
jgi:hypothetical protein